MDMIQERKQIKVSSTKGWKRVSHPWKHHKDEEQKKDRKTDPLCTPTKPGLYMFLFFMAHPYQ